MDVDVVDLGHPRDVMFDTEISDELKGTAGVSTLATVHLSF